MMILDTRSSTLKPDELTPRVTRLRERLMADMLLEPQTWNMGDVSLVREDPSVAELHPWVRYALATARMLREIPIGIYDEELIVGDIPRRARWWLVPNPDYLTDAERSELGADARFVVGKNPPGHYAADYETLLDIGVRGFREKVKASLARLEGDGSETAAEDRAFCQAALVACDAVRDFAERYARLAAAQAADESDPIRRRELEQIAETCRRVPEGPARSFREAVQSIFCYHAILQIVQMDAALGRLDQVLWPAFEADFKSGRITMDEAQELIDCFILKLNCFVCLHTRDFWGTMEPGLQNVILGGKTQAREDVTNDLTYLFLNSLRRLKLNNPTISVRLHDSSPEPLVRACADLLRGGGGFPALYNDEVFIPGLIKAGIPAADAYDYANDGCWETTIPGKTRFFYVSVSGPLCLEWTLTRGRGLPVDWRQVACLTGNPAPTPASAAELSVDPPESLVNSDEWRQQTVVFMGSRNRKIGQMAMDVRKGGIDVGDPLGFSTFEELYSAFCRQLDHAIAEFVQRLWNRPKNDHVEFKGRLLKPNIVGATLVSDCADLGRSWTNGGPRYSIYGTCVYGLANVGDSLLAIQKLVFEERKLTMARLLELLSTNFEGAEAERQLLLTRAPRYGDGSEEGVAMTRRLIDFMGESIDRNTRAISIPERQRGRTFFTALVGTFGNTVLFGRNVGASPDGRFACHPIAVNLSPSTGASRGGPTAVMRSYARLPLETLNAGAPLDLSIDGSALAGEEGLERLTAFIRGFVELRGELLTVSFVDAETLRQAQKDPHSYRDLRVRMGGWNAYFVGLNREEQEHQIARAEHGGL